MANISRAAKDVFENTLNFLKHEPTSFSGVGPKLGTRIQAAFKDLNISKMQDETAIRRAFTERFSRVERIPKNLGEDIISSRIHHTLFEARVRGRKTVHNIPDPGRSETLQKRADVFESPDAFNAATDAQLEVAALGRDDLKSFVPGRRSTETFDREALKKAVFKDTPESTPPPAPSGPTGMPTAKDRAGPFSPQAQVSTSRNAPVAQPSAPVQTPTAPASPQIASPTPPVSSTPPARTSTAVQTPAPSSAPTTPSPPASPPAQTTATTTQQSVTAQGQQTTSAPLQDPFDDPISRDQLIGRSRFLEEALRENKTESSKLGLMGFLSGETGALKAERRILGEESESIGHLLNKYSAKTAFDADALVSPSGTVKKSDVNYNKPSTFMLQPYTTRGIDQVMNAGSELFVKETRSTGIGQASTSFFGAIGVGGAFGAVTSAIVGNDPQSGFVAGGLTALGARRIGANIMSPGGLSRLHPDSGSIFSMSQEAYSSVLKTRQPMNMGIQTRHLTLSGSMLGGMAFSNRKRRSRGFNRSRGNRF